MTQNTPVILIVIDGMRPDGLHQADTPIIDSLISTGTHTLTARSVMPSITLPCHVSMFHGMPPEAHGVTTNIWAPHNPPLVGLFEVLQAAGKKTAMFYNWEELRDLSRPGSLEASLFLKNCHDPQGAGDTELAEKAAGWLSANPVDFAFIYLGYTDVAGHDHVPAAQSISLIVCVEKNKGGQVNRSFMEVELSALWFPKGFQCLLRVC